MSAAQGACCRKRAHVRALTDGPYLASDSIGATTREEPLIAAPDPSRKSVNSGEGWRSVDQTPGPAPHRGHMIPWLRDWTLILRLADRLAREHFDRDDFLRIALEVFAEEMEPVVGVDPRD